jgi:hypothetical protein
MVLFKTTVAGALLLIAGVVLLTVGGSYITAQVQVVQRQDVEQHALFLVGDLADRQYTLPASVSAFGSLNVTQAGTNQSSDIQFTVFDADNYQKWTAGQQSNFLFSKDEHGQSNFTFTTTDSGPYYFVFDNRVSLYKKYVAFTLGYNEVSTSQVPDPRVPYVGWGLLAAGLVVLTIGLIKKAPISWA